jgi:hypothetical protein
LKINLAKLEVVHVGVVEDVGSLASILDCRVLFAYEVLGFVVGGFVYGKLYLEWYY